MPVFDTSSLKAGQPVQYQQQIYNALDAAITLEVFEELQSLFTEPPLIYNFARALQGPALEMMLRGFKLDEYSRQKGISTLKTEITHLYDVLNEFASAVWDRPRLPVNTGRWTCCLNPASPKQLQEFFYSTMHLPEKKISIKGEQKLSTNREVLEYLEVYLYARPIIATILAIRERLKRLSVLETEIDPDGRMRTSYNIAGTETGRWSSSSNASGTGTNLQNITPELRNIFVADQGWKLCSIDLEQAESREVGWLFGTLFGDWSYLDACEGGDLHTTTAKLIWRDLPWTQDARKDREIAERPFYRHFSYRDMSKRGGHLTSYFGTAWTASRHLKVPQQMMIDFQSAFAHGDDAAFPGFLKWWKYVAQELQTKRTLTTPFGRTRHFFGRPTDDTTLREAIAYSPQSATGDRTNLWLYRIWRHLGARVQLLAQVHDSVTFQFREDDDEQEVVKIALSLLHMPMTDAKSGRTLSVPGEAKTGWNWGAEYTEKDAERDAGLGKRPKVLNPNGLKKVGKTPDLRRRLEGLERVL